ncbi:MAG: phage integrase N-terminal SAM-like domain-containing protein [Planctomycetaceae bacterium]
MSHDHETPAHNDERSNDERNRSRRGSNRERSRPPTLRERMLQDLQLRGMAERTQQGYLREVRKLAAYYNMPPDQVSELSIAAHRNVSAWRLGRSRERDEFVEAGVCWRIHAEPGEQCREPAFPVRSHRLTSSITLLR